MKNIYMLQPCDTHGDGDNESAYLPYATGLLAAYAFKSEIVKNNFRFKRFIYRKEDIDTAIAGMEEPAVVGFSTYIWNYEYNKTFAEKLKARYPDCVTVFGGHNILIDSSEQLDEFPFIDILIHGEGEIAFRNILEHLCIGAPLDDVPNISFRDACGNAVKTEVCPVTEIDFPSPYLEGWFDEIINNDKLIFSALLETNRGCPYRCAYCDWGSIRLKIRFFPIERVVAEMRWFAEHKIEFCYCTDSNFGMFERDFEIVDEFKKIKDETGYPEKFQCCCTKSSGLAEYRINKKLSDCGLLKGVSIALQTLSPEALKNVNRENMSAKRYGELSAMYNEAQMPAYSEFIYALPGETYESFAENLGGMLEHGTTKGCFIHYCELLGNSELGSPENVEKYKLRAVKMPYTQFHSAPEEGVKEFSNIVVSTYSMDYHSWIKTVTFGLCVQGFQFMGVLQCFAKYAYFVEKVHFREFYEGLISFAENTPNTVIGRSFADINRKLSADDRGESISRVYLNKKFGNIEYTLEDGLCLECVTDAKRFFRELMPFFSSFGIEKEVLDDLLKYQFFMIRKPEDTEKTESFIYDWQEFFKNIDMGNTVLPVRRGVSLCAVNSYAGLSDEDYAVQVIWYGRKSCRLIYYPEEIKRTVPTVSDVIMP